MNMLFAIDSNTEEVIVSDSPKGSNKINFIERIGRQDNVNLFKAVEILTNLSSDANLDTSIFKAVDKVCQMIYKKHKETK
ncbi:MAG: hypothetical protein ACKO7P_09350 [Bacteroidota bacterium]